MAQLRLTKTKQKIGLIFAWIDAFAQHRLIAMMLDDRIVTGRDIIATERLRFSPKISELEFLIAHDARIRRTPGLLFAREIIDHGLLELVGFIAHVVRNT